MPEVIRFFDEIPKITELPERHQCCVFFTAKPYIPQWNRHIIKVPLRYAQTRTMLIDYLHDLNVDTLGIAKIVIDGWKPTTSESWKDKLSHFQLINQKNYPGSASTRDGVVIIFEINSIKRSKKYFDYDTFVNKPWKYAKKFQPLSSFEDIEKKFLPNILFQLHNMWYAADIQDKSFLVSNLPEFDFSSRDQVLYDKYPNAIEGIHSPYVYASGVPVSVFATHLEDGNIHSLNYCYFGQKFWYGTIPAHARLYEQVMAAHCKEEFIHCANFLRHKIVINTEEFLCYP